MSNAHPSSIHFISLPTSRQTINTLVQRCHSLLQVKQLTVNESRKIAADLCTAAGLLLLEPQNIIPSRHPRIIPVQQPQQQQAQSQQVQQNQSSTPARNMPPPLNFTLYPSASPTAVRLSSTRAATPVEPMQSPFARPTGPRSAAKVQHARSQHVLMLLQCFTFMLNENARLRLFLIAQRDQLGLVSPTAASPYRLPDAALRSFRNVSQFAANYFDHLIYESKVMYQALYKRLLALQTYFSELNIIQNKSRNNKTPAPLSTSSRTQRPPNDPRSLVQQVRQQTQRFIDMANAAESSLREQTNAVNMSLRCASTPAELESDNLTKLPATSMKNFATNVRVNLQGPQMLSTFPAPSQRRLTLDPIPGAHALTAAEARFSPFLTNSDCSAILQRVNTNRRTNA
ncbi:hypothetical protein FGB62_6g06 [Gracilaria domingensis]|nr:hypothetical protein FGB62_6g06 [Gracilaria domingensis]